MTWRIGGVPKDSGEAREEERHRRGERFPGRIARAPIAFEGRPGKPGERRRMHPSRRLAQSHVERQHGVQHDGEEDET